MVDLSAEARILAAIRDVPRGQVAGYGQIAHRAGLPGRARLVARILGRGGDDTLPWHRVLRSDGRIAFPSESPGFREQQRRLQEEGVDVVNGRVRMAVEASLDAALWGPPPGTKTRRVPPDVRDGRLKTSTRVRVKPR